MDDLGRLRQVTARARWHEAVGHHLCANIQQSESPDTTTARAFEDLVNGMRRGGRSMGEVLSRGWGVEGSARSPVGSDRRHRGAIAMMHIGSLVISTTTAGTFGQPRPCEQEGPAQGRSRPGIAGRDAAGSSMRLASSSGWLVHRSSRRPACDVTPWPQPARAGIGASSQAARSTQNTPANRGFARPDDSFTIQSLYD